MHRQSFNQASLVIVAFALAISAAGILFSPVSGAGVCYVRAGAGGANNGTSWADAYTNLQSALGVSPCTEIWVAAGTYKPASGADRTATFQLKSGVAVYGGFDGTETSREERDWETNLTILSGDIDSNDIANPAEDTGEVVGNNSYHVVTGSGADTSAILDGFIITAGKSDNPPGEGGGMYINGGTPTLVNIIFSGNYASYGGGGLTTYGGILTLTNAGFKGNSAQLGGGMANYTNITLIEVTFSDNFATVHAGGLYNGNSTATLNDVVFVGNSVSGAGEHYGGGAMYNNFGSAILNNVVFSGNTVDSGSGGGLYNYATGNVVLNNVTFSNNTASLSGGGIYVYNTQTTIQNSILWGNSPAQVNVQNPITVTNSLVQNGCPEKGPYSAPNTCSNIISANPQFTDFDGIDDIIGTLDDDLRLLPASPAVGAGNNPTCTATDRLGLARPQGYTCDMGAYELPEFSISGNAGSPGVTLEYTDGISESVTADGAGEYTLWVSPNWSGAITPSKTGYIFVPVNRSYTEVITNLIGQDYIAQGVPIITEGESAEVTMDEDGSPNPFSLVLHASDPDGYGLYW
ncbi:MAG: right-handed parallel beta-helix repeat-containing protein, partial [Anaerolineales bacterium]